MPTSTVHSGGIIAAAVVVPLVVVGVFVAVYFLWFRHWLLRRRQRLDSGEGRGKVQIDAAGDTAQRTAPLRYSKNPSRKLQQTESITGGYAAVGEHVGGDDDDAADYENVGPPRVAALDESQATYVNVGSKRAAAKKSKASAVGDVKVSKQGLDKRDAVPDYRAPAPPPQDGAAAAPDRGNGSSRQAAAAAATTSSSSAAAAASDQGDGAAYVKLVGVAPTKQPAKKKVPLPQELGPKNQPRSGHEAAPPAQALRASAGTAAATAAGSKPSKGQIPAVALRPPGLSGKAKPEPEITEDDMYVVPEAAVADHEHPPLKSLPSAAIAEDDAEVYVEPQGDDVYENY